LQTELHPKQFYRLPWSLNDNVLGWLEPTKKCNLYCEGCYSVNEPQSHKTVDQVREDLKVFVAQRKMDSVSIAGGDPLTHPGIVEIVRTVWEDFNLKPVLNTNGLALTPELLRDLKKAGLFGLTFHIDSSQRRPDWEDRSEAELNPLRQHYADMVADVGGLSCSFNATIFRHTVADVPMLMDWARDQVDKVQSMVFILFRTSMGGDFDYFANGEKVEADALVYQSQTKNPEPLLAPELVSHIQSVQPDFIPAAYLGGTKDTTSFKWLIAGRMGTPGHVHGYVGPKYMEMVQAGHHALTGRYVAYSSPALTSAGKTMLAAFGPFDSGVRKIARRWARHVARSPRAARQKLHFQSVVIIQPLDMMQSGEMNMCDGCPDMTVHNGELVWSCRLDEQLQHGCFVNAVPRTVADA
jgi:hypothetical protein